MDKIEIIFKTAGLVGMGLCQGLVCTAHTEVEQPDVRFICHNLERIVQISS